MGDLEAALRAFESMKDLPGESISYDHVTDQAFFQAMAFWRLGDKETARSRYAVAVARLNENDADNNSHRYFVRVHAEAADLLGVTANGLSPAHGARPAIFPPPD